MGAAAMASAPACGAIRSWTLPSLVGAYLDLALAYLFLCGALLTYLASKFLALFGLSLPCSCRDDYLVRKIDGVHVAVRGRFPFDFACRHCRRRCCCYDDDDAVKDCGFGAATRGVPDMRRGGGQQEESCGSVWKPSASNRLKLPDGAESGNYFGRDQMDVVNGIDILHAETPPAVHRRQRRRKSMIVRRISPPASLSPPLQFGWETGGTADSPFSCKLQRRGFEDIPSPDRILGNHISSTKTKFTEDTSCGLKQVCGSKGNESIVIRDLKEVLDRERSALAALYLDLEKERSASATAADEAMAMISRLQEEKASIEMEARQFQRMVVEKSVYDEEEMEILKEIILQQEREKHVLEKEVEAYQAMMFNDGDVQQPLENYQIDVAQLMGENLCPSFGSSYNPELMLEEIHKSIEKKEKLKDKMKFLDDRGHLDAKKQNSISHFDRMPMSVSVAENAVQKHNMEKVHPKTPDIGDECNVQDKSMVTMEGFTSSMQKERSGYEKLRKLDELEETGSHELTSCTNDEDTARNRKNKTEVPIGDLCMRHGQNTPKTTTESFQFETDASVLDVHVINDKTDLDGNENVEQMDFSQKGCTSSTYYEYNTTNEPSMTDVLDDPSTPDSDTRWTYVELNIHRSHSDNTKTGHSMDSSRQRASWFHPRRSSTSAVDNERFKIENEVEVLRKRLKLIQQGRKKLNLSVEQREKEANNLQLLDEISSQLQEIRKEARPGTSTRQSSLPPSSSKGNYISMIQLIQVNLRKRRHSVSGALRESNT
nr:PREDICTED: polyamine-modulated factor 1-binding protein 1-like [Musa acuminata subsp. malaccensis]